MSFRDVPLTPMRFSSNNQIVTVNPIMGFERDEEVRYKIWGPYYGFALSTLQIFPYDKKGPKSKIYLNFLPNIVAICLLLARGIYMMIRMGGAMSLSLFWAYGSILFFTSLHGLIGAVALLVFKTSDYFGTVVKMMRTTTKNQISSPHKGLFVRQIIGFLFVLIPAMFFIAENYQMYDYEVTDLLKYPNITANQTAQFRKSMFGNQSLFFLDSIIILIGAYLVANALALYYLANQAICREYKKFNKQLKDHIADGSILQLPVMKAYESQLIDYLSTARFITNTASFLIDVTFMAALLIQISAQFALKGYGNKMHSIQNTLFGIWTAQSIYYLFMSTRKPAMLQELLIETNAMLWLDQGIWSKCDDVMIREIARSISERINTVDYASKGLSPVRASNIVFNVIMFVIPFLVDILTGFKYIPWYMDS